MNPLVRFVSSAFLGLVVVGCGSTNAAAPPSATASGGAAARARNGTAGELVQISGSTLTLNTQSGDVTVTLSSATTIIKTSTATLADIVPGSCVLATGQKDASGQIVATTVRLTPAVNGVCSVAPPGGNRGPGSSPGPTPSGTPRAGQANAFARGQVLTVVGTQVTLKDSAGVTVTIAVPTTVRVSQSATATNADLVVGVCVQANGAKDSSGTVAARALSIVPAGPSGCFTGGAGRGGFGGGGFGGGGGAPGGGGGAAGAGD